MLGHVITSKFLAASPSLHHDFGSVGSDPHSLLQALLSRAKVVAKPMGATQIQEDPWIGRIQPAGTRQGFDGVVIILMLPRLGGLLKQSPKRAFGNQALTLHAGQKMKDRFLLCKRSLQG